MRLCLERRADEKSVILAFSTDQLDYANPRHWGKYKLPQWVNRDQVHLFQFANWNSYTEHDRGAGLLSWLFSC